MRELAFAMAEDWYTCNEVGHGIVHLQEQYIDPFYRCNIWFIRGRDTNLLFDSGLGAVSLCERFPWLRAEPLLAVASHTHFDHIGNHHEFPLRACHSIEAEILSEPTREATLADRYARIKMFERLPPGGFDEAAYKVKPAPPTRLLVDGERISLGDRDIYVLHVPGHSPGSIALWEPATGVLFSGDAVYDGPLIDDAYHSNCDDYLRSVAALRELPVSIVHGGHFPSFDRDRLHALIDDYIAGRRTAGCIADLSRIGITSSPK